MAEMPAARDSLLDLFLPLSRFLFTPYTVRPRSRAAPPLSSAGGVLIRDVYSLRVIRNVRRRRVSRELARDT